MGEANILSGLSYFEHPFTRALLVATRLRRLRVECIEVNPDSPLSEQGLAPFKGRLLAHSVSFSLFDPDFDVPGWLRSARRNLRGYPLRFISVHFGLSHLNNRKLDTFLPCWPSSRDLAVATDRLRRLSDEFGCPVGMENLALALSRDDVYWQMDSLRELMERGNAYLLLDLHNVFCQAVNFEFDYQQLIGFYPLDRVLELHTSGGSDDWVAVSADAASSSRGDEASQLFRRDTHDGRVPEAILNVLPWVVRQCPELQWVIFERLPCTSVREVLKASSDYAALLGKLPTGKVPGRTFAIESERCQIEGPGAGREGPSGGRPQVPVRPWDNSILIPYLSDLGSGKRENAFQQRELGVQADSRAIEVCGKLIRRWQRECSTSQLGHPAEALWREERT